MHGAHDSIIAMYDIGLGWKFVNRLYAKFLVKCAWWQMVVIHEYTHMQKFCTFHFTGIVWTVFSFVVIASVLF